MVLVKDGRLSWIEGYRGLGVIGLHDLCGVMVKSAAAGAPARVRARRRRGESQHPSRPWRSRGFGRRSRARSSRRGARSG
eukprot:6190598-Pleurochrysis_carterae.AAC.2